MTRHSLSEINPKTRTATCSVCGPVVVRSRGYGRRGEQQWRCAKAQDFYISHFDHSKKTSTLRQARYRKRHPEKVKAAVKKWRLEHPLRNAEHRARKLGVLVEVVSFEDLALKSEGKCAWCGKRLKGRIHVDHIVPMTKGGRHELKNLQLLHEPCNKSKGDRQEVTLPTS